MFFVDGHFCNSTVVGWAYWQCVFFLNASRWNNPQEITGKFPGYLSPSAGLKFADVPNGLAAISKVPAAGQGWNNWIHLKIKTSNNNNNKNNENNNNHNSNDNDSNDSNTNNNSNDNDSDDDDDDDDNNNDDNDNIHIHFHIHITYTFIFIYHHLKVVDMFVDTR